MSPPQAAPAKALSRADAARMQNNLNSIAPFDAIQSAADFTADVKRALNGYNFKDASRQEYLTENTMIVTLDRFMEGLDQAVDYFLDLFLPSGYEHVPRWAGVTMHRLGKLDFSNLHDKAQSNDWVFSMVVDMIEGDGDAAPYCACSPHEDDIAHMYEMGVRDFVVFDDAAYTGFQLCTLIGTLCSVFDAKGLHDTVITVVIPFLSRKMRDLLLADRTEEDGRWSRGQNLSIIVPSGIMPRLYVYIPEEEYTLPMDAFDAQKTLAVFEHRIADAISIPEDLNEALLPIQNIPYKTLGQASRTLRCIEDLLR